MIGLYFLILVSSCALHVTRDGVFGIATAEGPVGTENIHLSLPNFGPNQPSYSGYRYSFLGKETGT